MNGNKWNISNIVWREWNGFILWQYYYLMMHGKSVSWMLWASMGYWLLRRSEKKETQDQRWLVWTGQEPSDA